MSTGHLGPRGSTPAAHPQLRVTAHAARDGSTSQRRSERLKRQGRPLPQQRSAEQLQLQLRQREAQLAELASQQQQQAGMHQVFEQQQQQQQQQSDADFAQAGPRVAAQLQEEAARELISQQLQAGSGGATSSSLQQQQQEQQQQQQQQNDTVAAVDGRAAVEHDQQRALEGVHGSLPQREQLQQQKDPLQAAAAAASQPGWPPREDLKADSWVEQDVEVLEQQVEAVEADYVVEERQGSLTLSAAAAAQGEVLSEISRRSEVLLDIMSAGEQVEEVIARHRELIDDEMLQLVQRRIQAAQELEQESEAVPGLQLLYRRLKAEMDRQRASPALRLLDELLGILDPEEDQGLADASAELAERRRRAAARLRAAFSGGLAVGADVLTLAAQLSSNGGSQLADQLAEDPVDPLHFLAESTELLNRVQEQQGQLESLLRQRGAELDDAQVAEARRLLVQRQAAAALVQQCIEIAQAEALPCRL